jgi:hypothetical protein
MITPALTMKTRAHIGLLGNSSGAPVRSSPRASPAIFT